MTHRERLAARFVADVVAGGGDARRMSNVTRRTFSPQERAELATMAQKALVTLVTRTSGARTNGKHLLSVVLTKMLTETITGAGR